jgi:hypothetical protein
LGRKKTHARVCGQVVQPTVAGKESIIRFPFGEWNDSLNLQAAADKTNESKNLEAAAYRKMSELHSPKGNLNICNIHLLDFYTLVL